MAATSPAQTSASATSASATSASANVQRGIAAYDVQDYPQAIVHWQQAMDAFTGDALNQALVQSNLSLAYQHLGQWQAAEQAIAASFSLLQAPPTSDSAQSHQKTLAQAWNTQGRLYWSTGQPDAALAAWQQATNLYQQANQSSGVIGGLLNQARALQGLGLYREAKTALEQVQSILDSPQLEPTLRAIGWRNLGAARRQIGDFQQSQAALATSLQIADQAPQTRSATLLELGNTQRALGDLARAVNQQSEADRRYQDALASYQRSADIAPSPLQQLDPRLNHLSLLVDTNQTTAALSASAALTASLDRLPASRPTIYARLNLAQSITKLVAGQTQARLPVIRHPLPVVGSLPVGNPDPSNAVSITSPALASDKGQGTTDKTQVPHSSRQHIKTTATLLSTAIQQARDLKDTRAESFGLGQLGRLYELAGQYGDAQDLTQQALFLTEGIQAADGRYRWEWQLGRLRVAQGDVPGAIVAYQSAINTLESVRSDLLYANADVQFSFRDNVEPVYRGLVDLLLRPQDGNPPSQANLRQAIRRVDALQLSELENVLGCRLDAPVALSDVDADPTAAIVYPILLDDRIAIILELPGQDRLELRQTPVSRQQATATLTQLYDDLSAAGSRNPSALRGARQVYQWLIAPIESLLTTNDASSASDASDAIQTLVFVSDGILRKIPMAALEDGTQYLAEKYAVVLSPRIQLFNPRPLPVNLTLFTGGIGEPQTFPQLPPFAEIPFLRQELDGISQRIPNYTALLDTQFTKSNLRQQFQASGFSVVHLKTHGVFSSNLDDSFIVAYQDLISANELGSLVQTGSTSADRAIELLVLSACETAQGDDRAVLGITGVAIRSGARSALATLWQASDGNAENTTLMIQFYEELRKPGTTKAQALNRAQRTLIEQGYLPHVWAPYILVGNWL